jgi:uncharacterized protein YdhG (YjbR/CyaY superfamily)
LNHFPDLAPGNMDTRTIDSIDGYISGFAPDTQDLLNAVRHTIQMAAPDAEETIKYGMPTFKLKKNLVHFAAFKNHIGFYPTSSAIIAFEYELSAYQHSKGAIQFPYSMQIPHDLITRIVQFRVKENTKT